jgi:hypothetical protein
MFRNHILPSSLKKYTSWAFSSKYIIRTLFSTLSSGVINFAIGSNIAVTLTVQNHIFHSLNVVGGRFLPMPGICFFE